MYVRRVVDATRLEGSIPGGVEMREKGMVEVVGGEGAK